jgi:hypothetical protein
LFARMSSSKKSRLVISYARKDDQPFVKRLPDEPIDLCINNATD